MKLGARDISTFLKSPDRQCAAVLLYGPDTGLIRERLRTIASFILGKDSDPVNQVELAAEQVKADPAILRDELCALSLMAGRRVVTLSNAGDKLADTIESALKDLRTTTYLIVEADELSPSSSLRQLFEKGAGLAALPCYREEGRNLEDTIRAALASHNLKASSDAMLYLSTHLGNDRGITLSEITKIALYMGEEKEVTLDIAAKLVGHNAAEGLEEICHAVACGNGALAHDLLTRLLHEGTQPVAVIRALLRHFQRLEVALTHIASGQPEEDAIKQLRPPVFFKYVPSMRRALKLWKAGEDAG